MTMDKLSFLKGNKSYTLISLLFLLYTLGSFGFYYERTLQGNLDNHILAGEMWGAPAEIGSHGVEPLYHGEGQTGWDGQFYYYMANDLFAVKDTAQHIDSPAYRYQRIGLAVYTASVATILGQDWVSPALYFSSYLMLLLVAVWQGAKLFDKLGVRPELILLWAASVGTQITLFNALPDASADAFIILAIAAMYNKKYLVAVVPFTLAALSREVYSIIPSILFLVYFFHSINDDQKSTWKCVVRNFFKIRGYHLLLVPGLIVVCWHAYLYSKFGAIPMSDGAGILGTPFSAWAEYLLSGLEGNHILVGVSKEAYGEAILLLCFMAFLLMSLWMCQKLLCNKKLSPHVLIKGLVFCTIILILLYISFGSTVMMHYTGYIKAIGLIIFMYPILLKYTELSKRPRFFARAIVVLLLILSTAYNFKVRLLNEIISDKLTQMSLVTETKKINCFVQYDAEIAIKAIIIEEESLISQMFSGSKKMTITVNLKNTSEQPFESTKNSGSVHMSYHWLNDQGDVIQDGVRTALTGVIQPGEMARFNLLIKYPKKKEGKYYLRLSPVQEGCAWFYQENHRIGAEAIITIDNS